MSHFRRALELAERGRGKVADHPLVGAVVVREVYDAGATLIVAASAIFGREDLPRSYRRLVQALA